MPDRPWRFDERTGRYRAPNGRLVSFASVRDSIDRSLDNAEREVRLLALQLQRREISLIEWELRMRGAVKDVSLYSGAAANGGWNSLSPSDLGRIGREVRAQYDYLRALGNQVKSGAQPLDGRFLARVGLFAKNGRRVYSAIQAEQMGIRGFTEVRSRRFAGDSCPGCVAMEVLGWVDRDSPEYIPIGRRQCLNNCRCLELFRNPATGEEADQLNEPRQAA